MQFVQLRNCSGKLNWRDDDDHDHHVAGLDPLHEERKWQIVVEMRQRIVVPGVERSQLGRDRGEARGVGGVPLSGRPLVHVLEEL